jgi:bifunctional non-homologous end joining protein LigD
VPRSPATALPTIRPMLLDRGTLPADEARWLLEVKYDGWRSIVHCDRGDLRVVSRRGNDITARVPELRALAERHKRHRFIVDGELVVVGADGRPDFAALGDKMLGAGSGHAALFLFDLLHFEDESLLPLPLSERKRRLGELALTGDSWRTVSYSVGNGAALLAASREMGLEGLVAKRIDSRYTPGRRSSHWIKVKNFERAELIIGGWEPDDAGGIHGLFLGTMDGERLTYRGLVEVGVGARLLPVLESIARPTSPFADRVPRRGRFVEPHLVADVQHLAGSTEMRHALLLGVRPRS